ncbi:MAG TPA: HDOD domain-containing protein [Kofleriaceae bacterium]|nr:HDOD domain-containing protein [Kofleriaceae bacterium]
MTSTIPQELDQRLVAIIRSDKVRIPPYPAIAMRLGQLLKRDDYSMNEVAALVTSDQALSAAVLRAANSARMGGGAAILSLPDAVGRIGCNELVRLAFTVGLGKEASVDGVLLDLRRTVWRQSVWSAFLCRELAARWRMDPDAAFLCGLLHDFGRVVALACVEQILSSSRAPVRLSPARCVEVVEAYHVELGMVIAEKWNLPAIVADVIRDHHVADGGRERDHVGLVCATDQVVSLMESSLVVDRSDLDAIATLLPEERDFLTDLLPALPGLVEGLDPQAGSTMPRVSQYMRSVMEAPEPVNEDVIHQTDLEASCRVFGDDTPCNVIGVGARRLQLLSPRAYSPQTVIQLSLGGDDGPFRMWCTLNSIRTQMRRHGERFVLEVKPFALTATAKLGWAQLLATLVPAAAPSSQLHA